MDEMKIPGFRLSAVSADIRGKADGRLDMGLIMCDQVVSAAGIFTKNTMAAAPVALCRERLSSGRVTAVLVNSGNANCMTGRNGMDAALKLCDEAGSLLQLPGASILPCSTGVIGEPLPTDQMIAAMPALVDALDERGMEPFSKAILTTDTCPKTASASGVMIEGAFTITGVAKGAGMIAPDMATMLCFIMTDAGVSQDVLQSLLADAADETFNMVTIDGDTSTNDTVIALCSGLGPALVSESDRELFADSLREVCGSLARQIVSDGEGATKVVEIVVNGADSNEEAKLAARSVAQSLLVKTALAAADPNWGRVAAAVGYSGVKVSPDKLSLRIGPVDILIKGEPAVDYDEANAVRIMEESTYSMVISLGNGPGMASILTTDLTEEYVRINCEYRS